MKHLIIAFFCCLVSVQNYALAPVVDDSENFAILDEQQADLSEPVANNEYDNSSYNEKALGDEKPLAHDEPALKSQSRVELLDKVQGMQQDIQELRGQLDMQSHDIKLLKDQQLAFYKDLDARLSQTPSTQTGSGSLTKGSIAPASTELSLNPIQPQIKSPSNIATTNKAVVAPIPTPSSPIQNQSGAGVAVPTSSAHNNPADEQISYMAAYELVKNKQFDDAINSMQAFVTHYPNGGYTANAQYWLGELYMVKKNYPEAIQHFEVVLSQYPNSSKTAASLLKVGYALAASGKGAEAKQKLGKVIKNYPDTATAQLAAAKLKSLNAS